VTWKDIREFLLGPGFPVALVSATVGSLLGIAYDKSIQDERTLQLSNAYDRCIENQTKWPISIEDVRECVRSDIEAEDEAKAHSKGEP
jgi:hypothetical protein